MSVNPETSAIAAGDDFAGWQHRLKGVNVSQNTFLATDYLNHFNEVIMLLEMIPDMPDMFEECLAWQPKSYVAHFQDSGFADKDLIIAAYAHVPEDYRHMFETTVERIDSTVLYALHQIKLAIDSGNEGRLRIECEKHTAKLNRLCQFANGVINGVDNALEQEDIDDLIRTGRN